MELKAGKVTKGTNLAVLKFLMPSHLDSFQLAFVGLFRIVLEFGQFGDVAVQVGEAESRHNTPMPLETLIRELNGDLFVDDLVDNQSTDNH